MKKTMFITSVIMVVVMAIALTTSSLAWFTVNGAASVTTNAMTISAAANASVGLLMSQAVDSGYSSASKTLVQESGSSNTLMKPLVPYSAVEATENDYTAALVDALFSKHFTGAKINAQGNAAIYTEAYADGYFASTIYVANAGDAACQVNVDIIFDDKGTNMADLYVAVLAQKNRSAETDNASNYELVRLEKIDSTSVEVADSTSPLYEKIAGTTVNSLNLAAEAIANNAAAGSGYTSRGVTVEASTSQTLAARPENSSYTAAGTQKFMVFAWYDGESLINNNSGATMSTANFVVEFTSSAASN